MSLRSDRPIRPTTREQLVEQLIVERYGCNDWWVTKPEPEPIPVMPLAAVTDDDMTCARRRRALDDEMRGAA